MALYSDHHGGVPAGFIANPPPGFRIFGTSQSTGGTAGYFETGHQRMAYPFGWRIQELNSLRAPQEPNNPLPVRAALSVEDTVERSRMRSRPAMRR